MSDVLSLSADVPVKKPRRFTFFTIGQSIFLTVKFFLQNRLLSYAGACSFSFLFSFIPAFMMIFLLLVHILHTSPETISTIIDTIPELEEYLDPDTAVNIIHSIKIGGKFEIIIGVFIFWMARRFFASIFDAMRNIFKYQYKRSSVVTQIFTFVLELLVILVMAVVIFAYISVQTVFSMPVFTKNPDLLRLTNGFFSPKYISHLPNVLIFFMTTIFFHAVPGTKPSKRLCAGAGFLCTLSFGIFRGVLHIFLNVGRYNLIYGVLGHVIISLMDIFFFFTFFLFFSQFIFVIQFLNDLLIAELYLLPKVEEKKFFSKVKYRLFSRPDFFRAKDVIFVKKDEKIFDDEDFLPAAYFIISGNVQIHDSEVKKNYGNGDFFGEVGCTLGIRRNFDGVALENSELVKIKEETFRNLAERDLEVAKKVMFRLKEEIEI